MHFNRVTWLHALERSLTVGRINQFGLCELICFVAPVAARWSIARIHVKARSFVLCIGMRVNITEVQ